MNIVFRKLGAGDAPRYRAARLDCLRKHPENFGTTSEDEAAKPRLQFEDWIEEGSPEAFMIGAFDGERLVGIVGFMREERRKTRHRGKIVQMYVDPGYRGRDVGEGLLRLAIETAFRMDGIEQAELGVVTENAAAIRLYERLGFRRAGVVPRYFKLGDRYQDEQLMMILKDPR